jgi:hypothetical protein
VSGRLSQRLSLYGRCGKIPEPTTVATRMAGNRGTRRFLIFRGPLNGETSLAIGIGTGQALVDDTKRVIPRCLTRARREAAFLEPEPPEWCIELEKWPYHTPEWKQWLSETRAGRNPPLPFAP